MIQQPERGQIWSVNFAPAIGSEIKKIRPAVVVNTKEAGRLPLCIVIPITDWKKQFESFLYLLSFNYGFSWHVYCPHVPTQKRGNVKIL
jgi:Growth inhibitor